MTLRINFLVALAHIIVLGACDVPNKNESGKPNIILIMADDLGQEVISTYGGESFQTPYLDQLAAEGMQFQNCYSTPLCTPSRVQLMTGKYNFRNYIAFGLPDSKERTFGHAMQDAGYKTCITGKWISDKMNHLFLNRILLYDLKKNIIVCNNDYGIHDGILPVSANQTG